MLEMKLFVIAVIVVILGLPLHSLFQLSVLILALVYVSGGSVSLSLKKILLLLMTVSAALALKSYLPKAYIQEGHNVVIPASFHSPFFQNALPAEVYTLLKSKFSEAYPARSQCKPEALTCWTRVLPVTALYRFSGDGFFQSPLYSRIVNAIHFSSLQTLRLGAVNSLEYNFYKYVPGNIDRRHMPYFVRYDLPPNVQGGKVCWQGYMLWKFSGEAKFSPLFAPSLQCKEISPGGAQVFAFSFAPSLPLKIDLELPFDLEMAGFFEKTGILLCVLFILLMTVTCKEYKHLFFPSLSVGATLMTLVLLKKSSLLGEYPIYWGGGDGLTHEGLGRLIAQALFEGKYLEALKGGEEVFYFMPGLRYFRALEKIFFGDTNYGYVLFLCFFPLIVKSFLESILEKKWAQGLLVAFLFLPLFERFGFAHYLYVQQVQNGHAETLGYGLFLAALALILKNKDQVKPYFWAHLLFILSLFMRPNLAIPAAIFSSFTLGRMLVLQPFKRVMLAYSSFLVFFLMLLHNWYFGAQWVLATSAAFIPDNFPASPLEYWHSMQDLLQGRFDSPALRSVKDQLYSWNKISDSYRLLGLAAVMYYAFKGRQEYFLRALAFTTLGSQILLLFFVNSGRYGYLAWFLTFTFLMLYLQEQAFPYFKNALSLPSKALNPRKRREE